MIRQPSTAAQLYAWHRAAISGDAPPVHDGIPECGWFRTRLTRGGPFVPVEIVVEREIDMETGELMGPERFVAICEGRRRPAETMWGSLTPISRTEFVALKNLSAEIPAMAATMAAIDLTATPMTP